MPRRARSRSVVFQSRAWPLLLRAFVLCAILSMMRSCAAAEVKTVSGLIGTAAASWRSFGDSLRSARPHLVAAAVARFASISAFYPLDAIKTRLQTGTAAATSFPEAYRGLGSSLVGQVPYGVLTFGSYELYKTALLKRFPELPRAITFGAAAILGDMTGSFWLIPAETVKIQVQGGLHTSVVAAAISIFKSSGVGGFYHGFSGQLGCDVPFRAIQLTSYELLRAHFGSGRKRQGQRLQQQAASAYTATDDSPSRGGRSAGHDAFLGGVAGAISATCTCPMDVVRTRMMAGGGGGAAARTWLSALKAGKLFSGLGTRVFYISTSSALFFVVYEATRSHLRPASGPASTAVAGKDTWSKE